MQRLSLTTTGTAAMGAALVLLFGGFLTPASAGSPINFMNPALGTLLLCSGVSVAQSDELSSFDRDSCEETCRHRYGVSPFPGFGEQGWERRADNYRPGYYLLAQCIDACNRRFWQDFNRKMEKPNNSE
jgi:hypothetical protein